MLSQGDDFWIKLDSTEGVPKEKCYFRDVIMCINFGQNKEQWILMKTFMYTFVAIIIVCTSDIVYNSLHSIHRLTLWSK